MFGTHVIFDPYHPSEKAYQIITDILMDKYTLTIELF